MTFAFQTREGVRGLFQVTGFIDNPRGVRMRYKLLQRTAQSAPAEATNQDGGSHEHAQILAKLHALKIERGAESSRWSKISEELSTLSKPQLREILPRVVGRDELLERLVSSLQSAQERLRVFDATNEPISAPGKTEREELASQVVQLERKTDERIKGILQGLKVRTDSIEAGVKGLEQAIEDAQRPRPGLPPGTATQLAAGFQVRLVAPEGSTEPADDLADPGDPAGRRQVRVLRQVLLDGSAIARAGYELPYGWKLEGGTIFSVTTGRSEPNLERCIELDLTLAGGRAWEEITATNLNRQLAIVFRGQVLFLKVIRQRLAGTHLTINAPLSADLVREVVAALNAVPGSPPQAWEFSEPIEATLLWQPRAYSAIDLESGRCLTNSNPDLAPPGSTFGVPPAMHEWMLTNGLDLTVLSAGPSSFTLGSCDAATCPITVSGRSPVSLLTMPTNGYPITAADVVYNWSLMTRDEQSSRVMFGTISSNQLDSYLFRTRKGCLGVLEVLRAPTNTPGVTIRYKRVQPGGKVRLTQEKLPNEKQPWHVNGDDIKGYRASIDHAIAHSGKASQRFESTVSAPAAYARMTQSFKAEAYRGRRIRYSGYVRTQDVKGWAGLFLRVDKPNGDCIAIDNMQNRPIKGTTDWTRYETVLDVPEAAASIELGLILSGNGKAWIDDLDFEVVGKDVATTVGLPDAPNLNIKE